MTDAVQQQYTARIRRNTLSLQKLSFALHTCARSHIISHNRNNVGPANALQWKHEGVSIKMILSHCK